MIPNPTRYFIYTGQVLPQAWPYYYLLAGNGVLKVVETPHFRAAIVVARARVSGLPEYPIGVELRVARVPWQLLADLLDDARAACGNGQGPIEQMYFLQAPEPAYPYWALKVADQVGRSGKVVYSCENDDPSLLVEIHSHHNMPAYFSGTDDADEQGCRFYGVVGDIFGQPQLALRLGVYGDFVRLPATALFGGES